jgi:hypothetical protein
MSERGMSNVVGQCCCLDDIWAQEIVKCVTIVYDATWSTYLGQRGSIVIHKRLGQPSTNLRDLQRVSHPVVVKVRLTSSGHLGHSREAL